MRGAPPSVPRHTLCARAATDCAGLGVAPMLDDGGAWTRREMGHVRAYVYAQTCSRMYNQSDRAHLVVVYGLSVELVFRELDKRPTAPTTHTHTGVYSPCVCVSSDLIPEASEKKKRARTVRDGFTPIAARFSHVYCGSVCRLVGRQGCRGL